MVTRHRKKSFLRRLVMPAVAAAFLSYFGYHAFNGAFGIWAMDRLEVDAAQLTLQRDALVSQRTTLEQQVAAVRPESLDADTVDLEARHALNLMRPDELVIDLGAPQH
jgi:cell division protein FtsB